MFFQRYPDQWKKLIDGITAKRNRGFDEVAGYLFSPDTSERLQVNYGIMCRMTGFDEVLRDFVGEYDEPEELEDIRDDDKGM